MKRSAVISMLFIIMSFQFAHAAADPLGKYNLAWTGRVKWSNVVNITDMPGENIEAKLADAQKYLKAKGGGTVYFPGGVYRFSDHIYIDSNVVLKGADPFGITDARKEDYDLATRFEFPKYIPGLSGSGTPIETAFKGIMLADKAAENCGIMNIAINRGHINFESESGITTGRNRFVVGCVLTNCAAADKNVPNKKINQHPWQRFTARHHAAVTVKALENILVANNRLPKSGDDNFTMGDYIVKGKTITEGVVFDYDNRPGLYINDTGIGGPGGNGPDGTPETHPWGFRKGIVIDGNYVYCTGRCAISFSGDGTICRNNVIRFEDNIWRPTTTGTNLTSGSATNDNRAVQMRGWRWTVEGNDYIVYRNISYNKGYRINDGEGLMHEDHVNSTVLDSKLINNKGNSYLSIYKTAGIDGLIIRGNDIRTSGGIQAIYAVANRNSGKYPCRNVLIENNITSGSGIIVAGEPAGNNIIRNNRHIGPNGRIYNQAAAEVTGNRGYEPAD